MINLVIFDFVMKSGVIRNLATSANEGDANEGAAHLIDNFAKFEALSGYDPRTKQHWRVVTGEVAIVTGYAGEYEELG